VTIVREANAMTLGRIERYDIEQRAQGVLLRMRQRGRALTVAFLSVAVLFVSWWFGPYGPRPGVDWGQSDLFYWLWSGFFLLVFVLGLLGAWYQEEWTIAEDEFTVSMRLGPWRKTRRVRRARSLGIRVEVLTSRDDRSAFPYRLRFLDADGSDSGLCIELQRAPSVDKFLRTLSAVLAVEVDDPRSDPPATRNAV
jgi:hypothetical protein